MGRRINSRIFEPKHAVADVARGDRSLSQGVVTVASHATMGKSVGLYPLAL